MSLRAALIFVFAVVLLRLLPRKSLANTSVIDVMLTVLLGSSLSRALTGNAPLGPTLVASLVLGLLWIAFSWLAVRNETLSFLLKGRPIEVIRDGEVLVDALRRAQMGRRDLEQSLRRQGYRRPEEVKRAFIERNGAISVIEETEGAVPPDAECPKR
ncbi:DUF421 domain-containing protein [Roseivivax sp. CAU 1761]